MKKYQIGLYEKAMPNDLGWEQKLRAAKEAGYDYVELSIDATKEKIGRIDMGREERFQLLSLTNEIGMPLRSMCVSALTKYSLGNEDEGLRAYGLEIAAKAIGLAADLGIRVVMIPGYDVYYEESTYESKRLFMENVRKVTEDAASAGVVLGFETMENSFMNTIEKAMKYVTLCNSSYLQIYPDTGNLTNAGVMYQHDILEDMELGCGHIAALHLKETVPGVFREVPYGEGHVDFESIIRKAWELGVRRYVTEFWYQDGGDWKQELVQACSRFRKILDVMERDESK